MWISDMGSVSIVAKGDHVRAVGWLALGKPFPQGRVSPDFATRLREFARLANHSSDALSFPAFGGFHTCEFCQKANDSRNLGVPYGDVLFVAPAMIAHYVEVHSYRPPQEFMSAVAAAPLPNTEEFKILAAPFRQIQEAHHKKDLQERFEIAARRALALGGTDEAFHEVAELMFGNGAPEVCDRIRQAVPPAPGL
jgi:hypothetical protein